MSKNYDNWERLVAAVLKREQFRKMCHENSRTPSLRSSVSSDYNSSFRLNSLLSNASFDIEKQKHVSSFRLNSSLSNASFDMEKQKHVLEFFKGSPFEFDLKELLMASPDVLGGAVETFKRTFFVSLRKDAKLVVVKTSKFDSIIPVEVLEEQIKILGSIENENVVRLRGYYLSKGKMLGFYDYFPQGSVYQMLHGNGGENKVALDWATRVRVAIGAAKGLAFMHKQFDGKFVHGNIRASNIFLNSQGYGCLGGDVFSDFKISEYHPPEVLRTKMLSLESDVYSFGVFLIELLSGKSPWHHTDKLINFVHLARHTRTALFNKSLLNTINAYKEMVEMLEIALSCVRKEAKERPDMNIVVEMLGLMCCEVPLNFFSSYRKWTAGM